MERLSRSVISSPYVQFLEGKSHLLDLERTLKLWDTLPRLCDCAMSPYPELQLMRSWRAMLTQAGSKLHLPWWLQERLAAEAPWPQSMRP